MIDPNICNHDRIYSGECYPTNPIRWHWLCAKCGEGGADAYLPPFDIGRYIEGYKKFRPDTDDGVLIALRERLTEAGEQAVGLVHGGAIDTRDAEPVRYGPPVPVPGLFVITGGEPLPPEAEGLEFAPPVMRIKFGRPAAQVCVVVFERDPQREHHAIAAPQSLFRPEMIAAWGEDVKLLRVLVGLRVVAEGENLLHGVQFGPAEHAHTFVERLKACEIGNLMRLEFSGPAPTCLAVGMMPPL